MAMNEKLQLGAFKDGPNEVATPDGKATLTFHSVGGEVTQITAVGSDGKPLPVTIPGPDSTGGGVKCTACVEYPAGTNCYEIDCNSLPKMKTTKINAKK